MKKVQDTSMDFPVPFERVDRNSWIAFIIFVVVLTKDILVSGFEIIPVRSPLNREISWLFILPISVIGLVLAIQTIRRTVSSKKKDGSGIVNVNLVLSVPILLYIVFALLFL